MWYTNNVKRERKTKETKNLLGGRRRCDSQTIHPWEKVKTPTKKLVAEARAFTKQGLPAPPVQTDKKTGKG